MRLRIAVLCATVGLVCAADVMASAASRTPGRTVPCRESIDGTKFPYVGSSRPRYRYRLVLGAVSVPPGYLAQVVRTGETPWPYWRKAGLVVRARADRKSRSLSRRLGVNEPGSPGATVATVYSTLSASRVAGAAQPTGLLTPAAFISARPLLACRLSSASGGEARRSASASAATAELFPG